MNSLFRLFGSLLNKHGRYKVFGKSFKYNQICDISNVSSSVLGVNVSVENNKIKFVGTATSSTYRGIGIVCNKIVDHYYAILINNNTNNIGFNVVGAGGLTATSKVVKATGTDNRITVYYEDGTTYNSLVDLRVVDLTELFGAGNEPTTLEQFYATDLGKAIQKGWYPPYSPTNAIYKADLSEATFVKQRLPEAYQEVEYIESDGHCTINIGNIDCDFFETISQYTEITGEQAIVGNGQSGSTSPDRFELFASTTRQHYSLWSGQGSTIESNVLATEKAKISFNYLTKEFVINDTLISIKNEQMAKPKYLFSYFLNFGGAYAKIYKFLTKKNNLINHNLVPCYRKADNVIGMYDTVNGVFYTNQGTGTFLKGNDNDVIGEKQTVSILQNGQPLKLGGIGTAKDYYLNASGKVNRAIGNVDLGTLNWSYQSDNQRFYGSGISTIIKKPLTTTENPNIICNKYKTHAFTGASNGDIYIYTNGYVYIKDIDYTDATTFKTAMSGVILHYELATPTTEQANSVMLRKGFTKCYDKNYLELEIEVIDNI